LRAAGNPFRVAAPPGCARRRVPVLRGGQTRSRVAAPRRWLPAAAAWWQAGL